VCIIVASICFMKQRKENISYLAGNGEIVQLATSAYLSQILSRVRIFPLRSSLLKRYGKCLGAGRVSFKWMQSTHTCSRDDIVTLFENQVVNHGSRRGTQLIIPARDSTGDYSTSGVKPTLRKIYTTYSLCRGFLNVK
jgi:hypothetical protein